MTGDLQPGWLRRVNDAMDLPPRDARRVLDAVLAERCQRACELRELAARDDLTDVERRAYVGMALWVDDSIVLVEQAAVRLAELDAAGHVTTGREQIHRETGHSGPATPDAGDERSWGWSL